MSPSSEADVTWQALGGVSSAGGEGSGPTGLPSGVPHQGKQHFQAPTSVPTFYPSQEPTVLETKSDVNWKSSSYAIGVTVKIKTGTGLILYRLLFLFP